MKFKKFYYKKIKSTNDKALKHISKGYEKGIELSKKGFNYGKKLVNKLKKK